MRRAKIFSTPPVHFAKDIGVLMTDFFGKRALWKRFAKTRDIPIIRGIFSGFRLVCYFAIIIPDFGAVIAIRIYGTVFFSGSVDDLLKSATQIFVSAVHPDTTR